MSGPHAEILADSISPDGVRLTTFKVICHRYVLAEFNTHRTLSRNSASSRAIPLAKQVAKVRTDPAVPLVWPAERKGMQGGEPLAARDQDTAQSIWQVDRETSSMHAEALGNLGLHKSVVNRLLEPHLWHTIVCTATAWENFFAQRCSPLAQPEIKAVADLMQEAYRSHQPKSLIEGEWHLPFIDGTDWSALSKRSPLGVSMYPEMIKISAARCARTSYETQDGTRDLDEDLDLYDRLVTATPPHWSPLEHVATPWPANRQRESLWIPSRSGNPMHLVQVDHLPKVGNLLAWRSQRTTVEAEQGQKTYR